MAKPVTFKFGEMLVAIGDGGSPEIFTSPCGLTTKTFGGTAATADTNVPDCDDPDAPSWLERDVTSLTRDITGTGVLAEAFLDDWDNWFASGDTKNCKVKIGDFEWTGPYILSTFNITGNIGNKLQINVSMQSDGQISRATVSV